MARALRNDILAIENAGAKIKFQIRYRALAGISTAIAMMITEMVTAVSSCMRPLVFLFIVFLLKKLIKKGTNVPKVIQMKKSSLVTDT
jgi:hypothetical protein